MSQALHILIERLHFLGLGGTFYLCKCNIYFINNRNDFPWLALIWFGLIFLKQPPITSNNNNNKTTRAFHLFHICCFVWSFYTNRFHSSKDSISRYIFIYIVKQWVKFDYAMKLQSPIQYTWMGNTRERERLQIAIVQCVMDIVKIRKHAFTNTLWKISRSEKFWFLVKC